MTALSLSVFVVDSEHLVCGGPVSGHVTVRTTERVRYASVRIALTVRTEGKGTPYREEHVVQQLDGGEWPADTHDRITFTGKLPEGPRSYDGKLLKVSWALSAVAVLATDERVEASQALVLGAGTDQGALTDLTIPGVLFAPVQGASTQRIFAGLVGAGGILFFGIYSALTLVGHHLVVGGTFGCCAVVLVPLAIWGLLPIWTAAALGNVSITFDPPAVAVGAPFRVTVSLTPTKAVTIIAVHFTLRCAEVTRIFKTSLTTSIELDSDGLRLGGPSINSSTGNTFNSSTPKASISHELLYEGVESVAVNQRVAQPFSQTLQLTIPRKGLPSLAVTDNAIVWELEARLELQGMPAWSQGQTLTVVAAPKELPADRSS